ncbi:MAG: hypothetical protein FJZ58_01335 [Chlamydiae bacterium]|nr:hypothetical protein [Chlamydiota bacterium]
MQNLFSIRTFGLTSVSLAWGLLAHAETAQPSNKATLAPYRGNKDSTAQTVSQDPNCPKTDPSFRFRLKHREANGIGYNQGYSSLDGFFVFGATESWFPFLDFRAHLFNNGKPAANLGFGLRYLPDHLHAVFGINGFLDIKATSHSSFEQVGAGIEILGTKWQMQANGYFPMFSHNHLYQVGFYTFQGNHALFRAKRELAFKGYDLSCKRLLWSSRLCDLSATLGGYQFFADYEQRASGGLFKMQTNLTPYLSFEGQASYDSLFKGILQIQMSLSIPFGKRISLKNTKLSCVQRSRLAHNISEEVDRFEMIVTNPYHTDSVGKDPRTNNPLHIVFVNNTASSGSGTAEHPFNTLQEAQDHASTWDMIYVYGGDGSPRNMNHGITLQEGQWLQGSSRPFFLRTTFGPCAVPKQTRIRPSLRNETGNTVTLSSHNIVAGFDMRTSESGIFGSHIEDITVDHVFFKTSSVFDINLDHVSGEIAITDNSLLGNQGLFLNTAKESKIILSGNQFVNTGSSNMQIHLQGDKTHFLAIEENRFSGSQGGSLIEVGDSCSTDIVLQDNRFSTQSGLSACLNILSSAHSTTALVCENNDFSSPSPGLRLESTLFATSTWTLAKNVGHYSASSPSLFPFTFLTSDIATATLYLAGNFANSRGFFLGNPSSTATFKAASLDLTSAGLENLNVGSFTIDGTITYIPFPSTP